MNSRMTGLALLLLASVALMRAPDSAGAQAPQPAPALAPAPGLSSGLQIETDSDDRFSGDSDSIADIIALLKSQVSRPALALEPDPSIVLYGEVTSATITPPRRTGISFTWGASSSTAAATRADAVCSSSPAPWRGPFSTPRCLPREIRAGWGSRAF